MSHDSTPIPAATQSGNENQNQNQNPGNSDPASDDLQPHDAEVDPEAEPEPEPEPGASTEERPSATRRRRRRSRKAGSALAKKLEFTTHLLTTLDSIFFVEIGTLYYLESSFLRFLLRALTHYFFLTPKPDSLPFAMPAQPSHVVSILLPNLICLVCHLFMNLPKGSEAARGYLHGGIIIDFIGQTPPTSRLPLLALDIFIFAIQCLMLAVHSQREALRGAIKPQRGMGVLPELQRAIRAQTLDAEERGMHEDAQGEAAGAASGAQATAAGGDGEGESSQADNQNERSSLLGGTGPPSQPTSKRQIVEIYASGNAVIGDFHLLQTMRLASTDYSAAASHSIRTLNYTATIAALLARERRERSGRR